MGVSSSSLSLLFPFLVRLVSELINTASEEGLLSVTLHCLYLYHDAPTNRK